MALFIGFVLLCVLSLSHQESCNDEHVSAGGQLNRELLGYAAEQNPNGSFLISGYSLIDPLLFLFKAAAGDTKLQLDAALSPFSKEPTPNELVCKSEEDGGASYTKATRLYLSTDYKMNPLFIDDIEEEIGSDVVNVDFSNADAAANEINSWVRQKTSDLIKSLVTPEDVNGAFGVIANTLFFQAQWYPKFSKENTKLDDFYVTPNKIRSILFMKQDDFFPFCYSVELDATVLEIAFKGSTSSTDGSGMRFFLPKEPGGLQTVVNKISKGNYTVQFDGPEPYLSLSLPKFEVETSLDLKDFLRKIGVVDIFDNRSQLPYISTTTDSIMITKAIQKAKINVDEDGVVAAASNAIYLGQTAWLKPKPTEFKLNRPFYFEIFFNKKVLFSGVFRGPVLYDD